MIYIFYLVVLAQLAASFAPDIVNQRKIFDVDQSRFAQNGLHFRHTDNINYFLKSVTSVGLPEIFRPETTDICKLCFLIKMYIHTFEN